MALLDRFLGRTHIAYFSMEIAVRAEMHTYAGGLGVPAGDTVRSCADLEIPSIFVTLVSRAGLFQQAIDSDGRQVEKPDWWDPARYCQPLDAMIGLEIAKRLVWIRPWLYVHTSPHGHPDSDPSARHRSRSERRGRPQDAHYLYGGDDIYRLKQELILGLGGIRLLQALGFHIHTHHLNEGHAAFLTLDLLNRYSFPPEDVRPGESRYDLAEVRERCVFTTHTPVEAGHDRFSYEQFESLVPDLVQLDELKQLAGPEQLK